MANADIAVVTVSDTFNDWRTRTNNLIVDRNTLRNYNYVKDSGDFIVYNGAVSINRGTGGVVLTVGDGADALITGTLTTTDLSVTDDATVSDQLTVGGNAILQSNLSVSRNIVVSQTVNVGGILNVNSKIYAYNANGDFWVTTGNVTVGGNTILESNLSVGEVATVTGNTILLANLSVGEVATVTGNTVLQSNATISKNLAVTQNATISGTADVTGNFNINTNRFNVVASSGDTTVAGDLTVSGGDIVSTAIANVVNTVSTTVNFAGVATDLQVGADTGTTNIRNNLNVSGGNITGPATTNLANTSATAVNVGGNATDVRVGSTSGTTTVRNNLTVANDLTVSGGDIVSTAIANVVNTTSTTVNFAGAATALNMGALTGTTTVRNDATVTGDLTVSGGDIVSTAIANVVNTVSTTVNFAGAATALTMGALTGTTTVRNDLTVTGDVQVNGNDIRSSTGAAALTLSASDVTVVGDLQVTGNDIRSSTGAAALTLSASDVTVVGDLQVTGNDIRSSTGAAALTLSASDVTVVGDLTISGGDIISSATANLLNTSATLVSIGGAAATLRLGAPAGVTYIRGNLNDTSTRTPAGFFTNLTVDNLSVTTILGTYTVGGDKIVIKDVSPADGDASIVVRRNPVSGNAALYWDDTVDRWRITTNGGSSYSTILTAANVINSVSSTDAVNPGSAAAIKDSYDRATGALNDQNYRRISNSTVTSTPSSNNDVVTIVGSGATTVGLVGSTFTITTPTVAGPQGAQGATGVGSPGAQGAQGQTGVGSPGAQGAQGQTGTGNPGAQGAQGQTGSPGAQGAQGATGAGPPGAQGAQGQTGAGPPGAQGAQGQTGTGNPGAQGAQGQNGSPGAQGQAGNPGGFTTNSDAQVNSLGVGTPASTTAGEIRATNNITAYYSDARLKKFLGTIENALEKVNKLNGYYFVENEVAKSLGYDNNERQVGISAQEVEAVLPEVVVSAPINANFPNADFKTVHYDKIIALLIEAIKELDKKVDASLNKNQ